MTELSSYQPDLNRLLQPRSIVIVGAQPEPASIGGGTLHNLERFGYGGEIHLVSRSKDEINGRKCFKTIDDIPEGIDVAVLIVPQAAMCEAAAAAIARGVGSIIAYASGFAEAGAAGEAAQLELARICRAAGVALLGPNCMGYTDYLHRTPLTFEPLDAPIAVLGPQVAIVAQSGATAGNIRFAMQARGIGVSTVIASGNEALLGAEDFLLHLLEDGRSAAIALYAEQLRQPRKFLVAARRARALGIPIVMLHPGTSARSRAAAQSHTGAIAGDHAVMQTIARREGVVVVDSMDELFDVTAILVRFPTPPAGAAAVVTNSGATRGLAFDFSEAIGLPLARLGAETLETLNTRFPSFGAADNPLDIGTAGFANPAIYGAAAEPILDDAAVGAVLLSYAGGSPKMQRAKAEAILPVAQAATKPVLLNITGDDYPLDAEFMTSVRTSGVPFFRSTERAMRAMRHVVSYGTTLARSDAPPAEAIALPLPPAHGSLPEHIGKRLLEAMGIAIPAGGLASGIEDGKAIAARIGYPVVIKAQAAALAHKSEAGGVIVGIESEAALLVAWQQLHANIAKADSTLILDGVLVEKMRNSGVEMMIGARRDPDWGPVLLVGLGGIWVEAIGDVTLLAADASQQDALDAIGRLRAAKLLDPFRGRPARDVDALAEALVRLGQVMRGTPALLEVDINPLMVGPKGEGIVALDALFVVAEPS